MVVMGVAVVPVTVTPLTPLMAPLTVATVGVTPVIVVWHVLSMLFSVVRFIVLKVTWLYLDLRDRGLMGLGQGLCVFPFSVIVDDVNKLVFFRDT